MASLKYHHAWVFASITTEYGILYPSAVSGDLQESQVLKASFNLTLFAAAADTGCLQPKASNNDIGNRGPERGPF